MDSTTRSTIIKTLLVCSLLALVLIEVESKCTRHLDGIKCLVTIQDDQRDFKLTLTNIDRESDVRVDIFKKVDNCIRFDGPSNSSYPSQNQRSSNNPRQNSALSRVVSRNVVIPRQGNLTLALDKINMNGFCSGAFIGNCRTFNNVRNECTRVIRVK